MATLTSNDSFWLAVEYCLVAFHKLEIPTAEEMAASFRARLEGGPKDLDPNVVYHQEPYYVACGLAGVERSAIGRDHAEYERVLARAEAAAQSGRAKIVTLTPAELATLAKPPATPAAREISA